MFKTVTAFPSWLYVGERNHVHNILGVISMWSCSCYVPCHVLFHPWMQSNGSHYKMGVLGNRPHLLLTELQRGDASWGGREPPRLYIYFRAGEGRNGLQQHGCPLWSISLFYIVSQQMGWGEKVASKESLNSSACRKRSWIRSCGCLVGMSTHSPPTAGQKTHQHYVHFRLPAEGDCGCASHRSVLIHPDANSNPPCRCVRGEEDICNGSLVFCPRSHYFLRDTVKCKNPPHNFTRHERLRRPCQPPLTIGSFSVNVFFRSFFKGLPQTLRLRELLFQQDKFALVHQTLV